MKKAIITVVVSSLLLTGCGKPQYLGQATDQKYYPTYGLLNEGSSKSKNVCYDLSVGNIIWSIILIETVVVPIYFIGWSIYNPSRLKNGQEDQCTFDS